MSSEWQTQRISLSNSSSTPTEIGLFRKRPFSVQNEYDEASPQQQELPDLQTLSDRSARFRQSLSRMKVNSSRPVSQPKLAVGISVVQQTGHIQTQPESEEAKRVNELNTNYDKAVADGKWSEAAVLLNGFNTSDILDKLRALSPQGREALFNNAPNWVTRVRDPLDKLLKEGDNITGEQFKQLKQQSLQNEQSRVKKLNEDYEAAVGGGKWEEAAELLNGFSKKDILSRLQLLESDPSKVEALHKGALNNKKVGPNAQVAMLTTVTQRANNLVQELQTLIDGATWKEIRKRVYPKESDAGVQRAKARHASKLPDLTGLGQLKTLDHFAKEVHGIQKNWASLSPDDRVKALGNAANVELKNAKVPEFLIVEKVQTEFKGFFTRSQWKFSLSNALVFGGSLSNDDAAELTNTTLHEGRHAEQQFLAARFSAGVNKKNSPQIVAEQGIPKIIADQAVVNKFDAKTAPTVAALGRQMYQATVTDDAKNQAISDDDGLTDLATKRGEAQAALNSLKTAPTGQMIADATARRDALRQQITVVEQKYTLYRNIPYEADAHEVGDAAEQAFKGWP